MSQLRFSLYFLMMTLSSAAVAAAQAPSANEVSSTGTAKIAKSPQLLRVQVELSAEGPTAADALAKLNARKDDARKKLVGVGANEKSIVFTDLRVGGDRRQQMEAALRSRIPRPARTPTSQPAASVSLSCTLKAEWALAGKNADELLIEGVALQEKIRSADPAGAQGTGAAADVDQELREEMEMMGQGGNVPSPLTFIFVAKISPEERTKALGEAFASAKTSAAELAKAAGAEIGPVRQLQSRASFEAQFSGDLDEMRYGPAYRQYMRNMPEAEPDEAIGPQPTSVTTQIMVMASFALK
jgi:uncharacterized protein YggE